MPFPALSLLTLSTTWNPNTPATINEPLIVSAPKINTNFNTIGDGFAQDHNALGSTVNVGQHIQSTYITQTTTPTADPNNVRIFSALVSAIPQLFLQYPTSILANPVQISQISTAHTYSPGAGSMVTEFSFFLNSQTIKIGTVFVPTPVGSFNITFNTPFVTAVGLLGCMPAGTELPQNYSYSAISITGFNLNSPASGTYLYIAIGQ